MNESTILIAVGVVLVVLVAINLAMRGAIVRPIQPPPPVRTTRNPDNLISGSTPDLATAPRFEDLVPDEYTRGMFSSQLQTETYNLRIDEVEGKTRFVVNGVTYNNLEEIPDAAMRRLTKRLLDKTYQVKSGNSRRVNEVLRQVISGDQSTIEARTENYTIAIQRQGGVSRYIVNGITYHNLADIPDLDVQRKARELNEKMF